MKAIKYMARYFFGICASSLLFIFGLFALGVSPDLPGYRWLLGVAFICSAAMVFDHFISPFDARTSTTEHPMKKGQP